MIADSHTVLGIIKKLCNLNQIHEKLKFNSNSVYEVSLIREFHFSVKKWYVVTNSVTLNDGGSLNICKMFSVQQHPDIQRASL